MSTSHICRGGTHDHTQSRPGPQSGAEACGPHRLSLPYSARPTAVHICYGYGTPDVKRWKSANTDWSHYEHTLPLLAASSIDQVSIETAASGVDISVIGALRGKDVLLGVVDTGNE